MKIIYNKIIPFKGYQAINLFGTLFVRKGVTVTDTLLNHEKIHSAQMKQSGAILFYIYYICEWIKNLFKYKNAKAAHRNISFEKEAYEHENDLTYLDHRPAFAQWD